MTLAITITHASKGYNMRAKITPLDSKGVPHGSPDHADAYQKIIADGESVTMYVHSGSILRVEEISPADREAQSITTTEVGDAGAVLGI